MRWNISGERNGMKINTVFVTRQNVFDIWMSAMQDHYSKWHWPILTYHYSSTGREWEHRDRGLRPKISVYMDSCGWTRKYIMWLQIPSNQSIYSFYVNGWELHLNSCQKIQPSCVETSYQKKKSPNNAEQWWVLTKHQMQLSNRPRVSLCLTATPEESPHISDITVRTFTAS